MLYGDNIVIQEVTEDRIKMLINSIPFVINKGDTFSVLIDEFAGVEGAASDAKLDRHVTFQELRDEIVGGDTGVFPGTEYGFFGRYANICGIGREG